MRLKQRRPGALLLISGVFGVDAIRLTLNQAQGSAAVPKRAGYPAIDFLLARLG